MISATPSDAGRRVTIVIVTYNSRAEIGRTLDTARPIVEGGVAHVIVVDNASADDTVEYVRSTYPWVELIPTGRNLGYGRGCNVGLDRAFTPYVMFQNPDAQVPMEAVLRMARFLDEHPAAGLVGPAIVGDNGILQHCGDLPTPGGILAGALGLPRRDGAFHPIQPGSPPLRTPWLGGAVMMGRRDLLTRAGGFDPSIFLYFDETDLCRRIGTMGFELWAVGEAVATHVVHASARQVESDKYHGCIAEHYFRSRFHYLLKHHGWFAAVVVDVVEWVLLAGKACVRVATRRPLGPVGVRLRAPVCRRPRFPEGAR